MNTMLNISLLLMAAMGTAGAIDFVKMFRSGEIENIYSHEEPIIEQDEVLYAEMPDAPPVPPKTIIETIKHRMAENEFELEKFSRAPLEFEEELYLQEEAASEVPEEVLTEVAVPPTPPAAPVAPTKPKVVKKEVSEIEFEPKIFSRAYIPRKVTYDTVFTELPVVDSASAWDY